ncbi:MAG: hypothetical protein V5B60_20670 [Accumulibacter sp.]|uniref:hypothetical protein n=1 Tax=Accumulibacter sp. TaxID=2053492 RepID=UPI002FC36917
MSTYDGTPGNDSLTGGAGNDSLNGLAGDDRLYGGLGDDSLYGGDGVDQLYGQEGNDTLAGGQGVDYFCLWWTVEDHSADTITDFAAGTSGDRLLFPYWRFTNYSVDRSDPFITGHAHLTQVGPDTRLELDMDGANGPGALELAAILQNVNKAALLGQNFGDNWSWWSPQALIGTAGPDVLAGTVASDVIQGLAGDDTLTGGAGADTFYVWDTSGDRSADTITDFTAGAGGDRLRIPELRFTHYWWYGLDPFTTGHARLTQAGPDTHLELDLDGAAGPGAFELAATLQNVSKAALVGQNLGGESWDVQAIIGTAGPDVLTGTAASDVLRGFVGDDTLTGGASADTFYVWDSTGDRSADTITDFTAGAGGDRLRIRESRFTNYSSYGDDPFTTGHARLTQVGTDTHLELDLDGAEGPASFALAATLQNVSKAALVGENLGGQRWNVHALIGTAGPDVLTGTAASEVVRGLAGDDTLTGGAGADTFYVWDTSGDRSADTITDFTAGAGGDWLRIPESRFTNYSSYGDDPFTTGHARLTQVGTDTHLELDLDGAEGPASFAIAATLQNVSKAALVGENLGGQRWNVHALIGTAGPDVLTGTAASEVVRGLAGDDTLTGGAGADTFYVWDSSGDRSADTITDFTAGAGGDRLRIPESRFTNYPWYGYGRDPFITDHVRLTQVGPDTHLELDLDGAGGPGAFELAATLQHVSKADLVGQNLGNESWNVQALIGTAGPDVLTGTAASEVVRGLAGDDMLTGGAGADTFYVWDTSGDRSADTITDFTAGAGGDRLRIPESRFTNYPSYGGDPFTTGHARLTQAGPDTLLELDLDGAGGSGVFELAATLQNVNKAALVGENLGGESWDVQAIIGTAGPDMLVGTPASEVIRGLGGNDTLHGGAGNDTLDGGPGIDVASYSSTNAGVTVSLTTPSVPRDATSADVDTLIGLEDLIGSGFNDALTGDAGNNSLQGGAGDDSLLGGLGDDTLDGGAGTDLASYDGASAGVTVTLATLGAQQNTGSAGIDTLIGVEDVIGSGFNDSLTGDAGNNSLQGGAGNDTLQGGLGNDILDGGAGTDTARYSDATAGVVITLAMPGMQQDTIHAGVDILLGVENLVGSHFNDSLTGDANSNVLQGGFGNDTLDGAGGTDTASYSDATAGVTVTLATPGLEQNTVNAGLDRLDGIEDLIGSGFNDLLTGDAGDNSLDGGTGGDSLIGGDGSDIYYVDNIADLVTETNADPVTGGTDQVFVDLASYTLGAHIESGRVLASGAANLAGNSLDNLLEAGRGNNLLDGAGGNDTVSYLYAVNGTGVSVSLAIAGSQVTGGSGSDTLVAIENLVGSIYDDTLFGDGGANHLSGAEGSDILDGGGGADVMRGGPGSDTYVVDNVGDKVEESSSSHVQPLRQVSTAADGSPGNNHSYHPSLSIDGRYVLFESLASLLVAGDTNGHLDIFIKDVESGAVRRVSTGATGEQANGSSSGAQFSADGRYVVFRSDASNLVAGDTNDAQDIFVKDLQTEDIRRVSTDATGNQANHGSDGASFSADGRYVLFASDADDLVADDSNGHSDIFVKDLQTGGIQRVSTDAAGGQANRGSEGASFSADSRYVLFESNADNLVAEDANDYSDIFVKDLQTGGIERVSGGLDAIEYVGWYSRGGHTNASFSASGKQVVFTSFVEFFHPDAGQLSSSVITIVDLEDGALRSFDAEPALRGEIVPRASFSVDGRYLVFDERVGVAGAGASYGEWVADDWDVFVKDLQNDTVRRVAEGGGRHGPPRFAADGQHVVFGGDAINLVEDPAPTGYSDIFVAPNPFLVDDGVDTVLSSLSYTLPANVENLVLAAGAYTALDGTGNELANSLTGNDGNNVLDGGGEGDRLTGGGGDDTYWVDSPADRVIEFAGGGNDSVLASCTFALADHVEALTLSGSADIDGEGNTRANMVLGNSGANVLDGHGGDDTISGGDGSDRLFGSEGNDALNGGAGADELLGGAGNDTLDGGSGGDVLEGGLGDDIFLVDESADLVRETLEPSPLRISVTGSGGQGYGPGGSRSASFSADGRYVLFESGASNLVGGDTNGSSEVFIKDLQTGAVRRVWTALEEYSYFRYSSDPSLSADGNYVVFTNATWEWGFRTIDETSNVFIMDLRTGVTRCVSTDSTGGPERGTSSGASFSADGRYVVYQSSAIGQYFHGIFVRDLQSGATRRVSTDAADLPANGDSSHASFSADGRYVVFQSRGSNLVAGDTNGATDIFVKDLLTGGIQRVSSDSAGTAGNGRSGSASFSADGQRVVFESEANNLVAGDSNGSSDVFVRDLRTGAIERVSTDFAGNQVDGGSGSASLSTDGRYLVFASVAPNLVANDTNGCSDVFVKDLQTGAVHRVSASLAGGEGNAASFSPRFSSDGRYILLTSDASNLVGDDTNGATDVFRVSNPFVETGGTDTVIASIDYVLPDRVERIVLAGSAHLNAGGNGGNNLLTGNDGNNVLDGAGGIDAASYGTASAGVTVTLVMAGVQQNTGQAGIDTLIGIEDLIGSGFNDFLTGDADNNSVQGAAGDDALQGGPGNDTLDGGTGNDTLDGGEGNDLLWGGSGADSLLGGDGSDLYYVDHAGDSVTETGANPFTGGTDQVFSTLAAYTLGAHVEAGRILSSGAASLSGNDLDNVLYAGRGNNALDGAGGADTVSYLYGASGSGVSVSLAIASAQATGGSGSDTLVGIENLTGSTYDDTLGGDGNANWLDGGSGNDTLAGGNGDDTLSGSVGTDTASYADASSGVRVSLVLSGPQATGGSGSDTLIAIEDLSGSNHDDTLRGDGNANRLDGAQGNDFLNGAAGNDTLDGGGGNDRLWGDSGADSLIGGDGSDSYYVDDAGDSVSESNANPATGGTDQVFSYLGAYTLTAHIENGRILATGAANLAGNALDNLLDAGTGNNLLDGAGGNDTVSYLYAVSGIGVSVSLAIAGAQATGGSGSDTLAGIENLTGSTYDDSLTGDGNANRLSGAQGNDTLDGGAGNDILDGGAGNDRLRGGTGADSLTGGDGSDSYYVDDIGDGVSEANANPATGGTDEVLSTLAAYTLGAHIENGRILATGAATLVGNPLDNVLGAGSGNNVLDGVGGNDTVSYLYGVSGSGVRVSLGVSGAQATGGSGSDNLVSIENLAGSTYADTLTGDGNANRLEGGSGDDSLDGGAGNDTLDGGAGNDRLWGGTGADSLLGGDGSDLYYVDHAGDSVAENNANPASGGTDQVYSFLSAYTLTAHVECGRVLSSGAANLTGNDLDNLLYAGSGSNVVEGADGNDTVSYLYGGPIGVSVSLAIAGAQATGGSGSDTLIAIENLTGSSYDDTLVGDGNANRLEGGNGNDTLGGGAGNDTLSGSSGSDTASYADAASGVSVSLAIAGAQATGGSGSDTLMAIENLGGSAYDDTLRGDANANRLHGGQGNDFLNGGAGNDTLDGGAGNDRLWGGTGADSLIGGDGSDFYYLDDAGDSVSETNTNPATGGTDQVLSYLASTTLGAHIENGRILTTGAANLTGNALDNLLDAGTGANLLDGAGGNDTVSYLYGASSGVSVSLALAGAQATGGSGSDTLAGIENLSGSTYDDTLTGDGNANRLTGAQGNDFLNGGAGNDTLDGGAGNDTLWGGTGADSLSGGDGADLYYVDHAGDSVSETNANPATGGIDQVFSSLAAYTLGAHIENGRILATGVASLNGNGLANLLYAGAGNNLLDGAGGNDTVSYLYGVSSGVTASLATGTATGGSGSDTLVAIENLVGSAYADTLSGDGGGNVLSGGNGNDTLSGGLGADTFRFDMLPNAATNRDTISDFNVLDDTIELENAIFASLLSPGTLAATSFRSGAGFSAAADVDDFVIYDSSSGALYYDANGNAGSAPVQIASLGSGLTLSSLDFVIT